MDALNLNKQKMTHIVIFIFILLSLIYLYNMNMIPSHTNTNTTKTISEKFMVISENQDLGTNEVSITNINQVNFIAGDESTISFANPNLTWPVTLQDLFDTKLNNSGVIGEALPTGHTPVQGIVLRDSEAKKLVVIGDNVPAAPTTATSINDTWIQFGGPNNAKEANSARISAGVGRADTLCIIGMGTATSNRKIEMWAEGGCILNGPLTVGGATNINGELGTQSTIRKTRGNNENLHIVSDKALYLMSKDNVIIYKCTSDCANWDNAGGNLVVQNNLTVDGTTTVSGKTNANGGLFTPYLQCNNTNGSSPGVGYFNGIETGWLEASSSLTVGGELGIGSTIRKKRGNGQNLHVVSDKALYLMSKDNVIIYKCTSDCENWDNASGNLVVENNLTVAGTATFSGALNAGNLNVGNINVNNIIRGVQEGIGAGNIHLVSKGDLYLMSPGTTHIHRDLAPGNTWESPSGHLSVGGNLSCSGAISFLPKGCIIMWGLRDVGVPEGWAICDGRVFNGITTPDFMFRFPIGHRESRYIRDHGGRHEVALTVTNIPPHIHHFGRDEYNEDLADTGGVNLGPVWNQKSNDWTGNTSSGDGCSGTAFSIYPPYCYVVYIMKMY